MEIERKWLLSDSPFETSQVDHVVEITQFYITGIRFRKLFNQSTGKYTYRTTIKDDDTLSRKEWETDVPDWVYQQMSQIHEKDITKTVYIVIDNGYKLEFHVFSGDLSGLIILECEFNNENEANSFVLPSWVVPSLVKEVTSDRRYYNQNLIEFGKP